MQANIFASQNSRALRLTWIYRTNITEYYRIQSRRVWGRTGQFDRTLPAAARDSPEPLMLAGDENDGRQHNQSYIDRSRALATSAKTLARFLMQERAALLP